MGPTASGKTQFAMSLRKYFPIELISVDSALIYRDMDIGTAKPTFSELLHHPHRLLNIKDPIETYSAAEFYKDAVKEINDIVKFGKIPCLVGGSMFYYNVLLNGLSVLPPSNLKIREYLLNNEKKNLHAKLKLIDPVSANRIHKNDIQRLLRALEIFYLSGKNLTELKKNNHKKLPYTIFQFAIIPPSKEWLNNRIELRVKKILKLGLQQEVERLFFRGDLHINLPSIRSIGYRQMWEYLEYKISYQDMCNKIINATKKLAKHQLTWLKKWKNLNKLSYDSNHDILIKQLIDILKNQIHRTI
ncbi:tRNA dimethylallyltransferase [Buchnera aphidicola (Diuraphis noxia)]|uniref:tRNA dimethylallyltransferase n=1 Tax=Buchnera aphidicola subsp. Diuraphis noxia TaxID=118101 RepID=A0A1B2H9E2_BUCDN|nr:tRNA (adenosine(37)-N6)-dimethylallyltransferase MiaA [Buchnera aphidicola]ANZ22746.1 tRNA dimethylallyltransferase [Buchnera aphidicola (Diuraphis noxia)]